MSTIYSTIAWVRANLGTVICILTGAQLFCENMALKRGWKWAATAADVIGSIPLAGRVPGWSRNLRPPSPPSD